MSTSLIPAFLTVFSCVDGRNLGILRFLAALIGYQRAAGEWWVKPQLLTVADTTALIVLHLLSHWKSAP